jgi:hypothetical protein
MKIVFLTWASTNPFFLMGQSNASYKQCTQAQNATNWLYISVQIEEEMMYLGRYKVTVNWHLTELAQLFT